MAKFYMTIDGKERPLAITSEEFAIYRTVCEKIWGGLPYDYTWATGTPIYQKALSEILNKTE